MAIPESLKTTVVRVKDRRANAGPQHNHFTIMGKLTSVLRPLRIKRMLEDSSTSHKQNPFHSISEDLEPLVTF